MLQMIVLPFDAILFNKFTTLTAINESNPVVGSSQKRMEGLVRSFVQKRAINEFLKKNIKSKTNFRSKSESAFLLQKLI